MIWSGTYLNIEPSLVRWHGGTVTVSQLIILEQNEAAEASPHLPMHARTGRQR